jgi:glyoxylase-like metal-dependent hydrolase (beta-lactamase superfamily II)
MAHERHQAIATVCGAKLAAKWPRSGPLRPPTVRVTSRRSRGRSGGGCRTSSRSTVTTVASASPSRWPSWFGPTLIDLAGDRFGPFPASMALTEAGDVTVVSLPGHSPGQLAVVVEDGDHAVFLAADSSYSEDALVRDVVDGVGQMRPPSTSSTSASGPTRPRRRPSTSRRTIRRPVPAWRRARHSAPCGKG